MEFDGGRFIIAPEGMISCNLQDDHVVVWYKNPGWDKPRFAQMGFCTYQQVATALLPIDLPSGTVVPQGLLAVLESAPDEVLVAYATWADDFATDRYPNVLETWSWLNTWWGEHA